MRNWAKLLILVLLLSGCNFNYSSRTKQPVFTVGGVYVADTLIKNKKQSENIAFLDSVYPILAFRVDSFQTPKMLIKYRLGFEALMDVDLIYNDSCHCFISEKPVPFAPRAEERRIISIYFMSRDTAKIAFLENNEIQSYIYHFTYIDSVDYKTHRNVYYAEKGFYLFNK